MKYLLTLIILFPLTVFGQKYVSENAYVRFYSSAPIEDIEAENTNANSVIDLENGSVVYSIKITGFEFEKSLMQEHFNENYMDSEKYPKSTFSGKIVDWKNESGKREVKVTGDLTIHGVTKQVTLPGTIDVGDGTVKVESVFTVRLEEYKVKIPKAVFYNIAEEVEVTVKFDYKPYNK